jgi:hypothetical protein
MYAKSEEQHEHLKATEKDDKTHHSADQNTALKHDHPTHQAQELFWNQDMKNNEKRHLTKQ